MSGRTRFTPEFAPEVVEHLAAIERKHHRLIRRKMEQQLIFGPDSATRNRKPLTSPGPFGSLWELRFGPRYRFRVFYEVDQEQHVVTVLAVAEKRRERLWIGGEEYQS